MRPGRPLSHRSIVRGGLFGLLAALSVAALAANKVEAEDAADEPMPLYAAPEVDFGAMLNERHHDDLYPIIERGVVRVLVTYSKTHYFVEQGAQHGLSFEMLREFENYLNKRYKRRRKGHALSVIPIPVARDELIAKLADGQAELAVANLTITPERQQQVDFSIPTIEAVREVVVASQQAPPLASLQDLAGKTVLLRHSSSFYPHMQRLNQQLIAQGLRPAHVLKADEHLEVEDLLEMANANLIPYTVVDAHVATLWQQIFPQIRVYPELSINDGGAIAWAVRKGTPKLLFEVNRFLRTHRAGTLFGNVLRERYLENPRWARRALADDDQQRFKAVLAVFRKYADRYDFNHMMLLAQGYQESRLDHSKRSPAGAIGIMQLMPSTGKAMEVGDIHQLENNVHAGSKYLRQIIDHYFNDPAIDEMNRVLLAFAAYNAGPTRISRLRRKAAKLGLDPNRWFGNVEHVVARYIGRETVSYVANISKYYIAYRLLEEQAAIRDSVKATTDVAPRSGG